MNKFSKQKLNKRNMTTDKRNQDRTGHLSSVLISFICSHIVNVPCIMWNPEFLSKWRVFAAGVFPAH